MEKTFEDAVLTACRLNGSVNFSCQREIVENAILPSLVRKSGQDSRGVKIGDDFMQFMADWGQECVRRDRFSGELLMELAMQRISRGALRHPPYNLIDTLPAEYKKYTSAWDEPGLMSQACFNFIKANLEFCCVNLENRNWKEHAQKLLVGLITGFGTNGEVKILMDKDVLTVKPIEIVRFAEDLATYCLENGVLVNDDLVCALVPIWRTKKQFLKRNAKALLNKEMFFFFVEYDKEAEAFGISKRKKEWLKLIKRLDKVVDKKIYAEIMAG